MPSPIALSPDALAIIERTHLDKGAHRKFAEGACAMELIAHLAGEPFSDHPKCVCPVLGAFVRAWNDGLPDDERDALLKPLLPRLIGTRGSRELGQQRALMAADWLVRVHTPAWLRLAKLDASADALSALPEIVAFAQIPSVRGPIKAAHRDAAAARAAAGVAAWAAAGDVAWDAAWDAARAAAWDAAMAAARAAAGDVAGAAAGAAARAAAGVALKETRLALQRSAADLVNRMIDATEAAQ